MLIDGISETDHNVRNFCYAATALAKQMMVTTKDAAQNAKRVLQYGLPRSFGELADTDARRMIEQGHFYPIATKIVEQFEANVFPQPNERDLLAAFTDATGRAIEEDAQKGDSCAFTQEYLGHMKTLAKELGFKGKNLFHPIRLAITGEMSGQDVTKQLSLLAMATKSDSVIDRSKVGVVYFADRMERLKRFCETIPEDFRHPRAASVKETKSESGKEKQSTKFDVPVAVGPSNSVSATDPKASYDGPPISALDIRVGVIKKVWEHPEAEKLYCEEIDVGEGEARQIASGLRPYMKAEDMEGRRVLVLCNLKERKLVGFSSHGMVLCASNADHTQVRLVSPPVDAKVGERITVPDFDFETEEGQPYAENKIGKKKVFESIAPFLVTNKYGVPEFLGRPFMTSAGVCTSPIPDGSVS
jgi:methionine--tRNA ligase beta chain